MIDPTEVLARSRKPPPAIADLVHRFCSGDATPRYLLGRTEHAAAIAEVIAVDGVIDDFAPPATTFCGRPVVGAEIVPAEAVVVNCSLITRPLFVHRRLEEVGLYRALFYADICAVAPGTIPLPRFVADMREEAADHWPEWTRLYDSLKDDVSRATFSAVLTFRLTGDPRHMAGYAWRPREQYFEPFLSLSHETFVDGGALDGGTTELLKAHDPDYRRAYVFEPSAANMARTRATLRDQRDVVLIEKALSDSSEPLRFDGESGSSSRVSQTGTHRVMATTLDEAVAEPVSFIKMDLEGWELQALKGAIGHLRRDRPHLAISAYHQAGDLRRIAGWVTNLGLPYDIYLRHYSGGWTETVLYFVRV